MKEYEWGMAIGIIAGIVVGGILGLLLLKMTKKDGAVKCKYDERQRAARGLGYKYGFFAFLFYNAGYAILSILAPKMPLDSAAGMLLGIIVAVAVNVTYCIWHDAYFALNEHRFRVMVAFIIIAAVNLIIGICNIVRGSCFQDGVCNFRITNLFCGLLFVEIFIVMLLKWGKEMENEEG